MLYEDPEFGFALSLPDNATPDIAQAHIGTVRNHYAQQAAQQQQQQQMQESLGWMGRVVGDAMAPATQFAPVISRAAAAAMTPQGFQQTAGLMANSAQFQQEQGMRQEQMGNMNRIEQERMRMRNAEVLQQQKDRKQEFTIRKQDYDLRKKEHDMQIKMQEDEQKYREKEEARKEKDALREEKMGTLRSTPGGGTAQILFDENGIPTRNDIIPGRAPVGRGGGGTGPAGGADTIQVQDPETKQLVTVQKFNPYGDYIDTETGKVYSRDMFKGGTGDNAGKEIHSRFTGEDDKEYILWKDGTTSPVFPEPERPAAPPAQEKQDGFFSGLAKTAAGLSALKQLMAGGGASSPAPADQDIPRVKYVEEAMLLKPGTIFIDPEGNKRKR
jgi:hypothetical protein